MSRSNHCHQTAGFSLLEVILATSIIAASSIVLLRLISTGQQHQLRGERQAIGQMICQSLVDEMTIRPELQVSVDQQRVTEFPDWTYTIDAEPTEFQGLVRIRIRAAETPVEFERTPDDLRYDFELVRWLRSDPSVDFDQGELEGSQ